MGLWLRYSCVDRRRRRDRLRWDTSGRRSRSLQRLMSDGSRWRSHMRRWRGGCCCWRTHRRSRCSGYHERIRLVVVIHNCSRSRGRQSPGHSSNTRRGDRSSHGCGVCVCPLLLQPFCSIFYGGRYSSSVGSLEIGSHSGGCCRLLFPGEPRLLSLLSTAKNIFWHGNAKGIPLSILPVAITKGLTCLFDGFPITQCLPRTIESSGYLASSITLEEPPWWVQRFDVTYDLFSHSSLLCGTVGRTVGFVGSCSHQRSESLVPWMMGNVDASSRQNVVIVHHDVRPTMMATSTVILIVLMVTAHVDISSVPVLSLTRDSPEFFKLPPKRMSSQSQCLQMELSLLSFCKRSSTEKKRKARR